MDTINSRLFLSALALLIVFGTLSSNAAAGEPEAANTEQTRKFTAASSNNFPPVNLLDENGQLTGFGPELSRAVIKAVGGELSHIHSANWTEVLDYLDSGRADFIHDTGLTDERKKFLDYTDPILAMSEVILVGSNQQDIASFNDLNGRTVACVRQHITHIYLMQFPEITCHVVDRPINGILALISGEVDAFIYPKQILTYLVSKHNLTGLIKVVGQPTRTLTWHMTVKKGNQEVLDILNTGIRRVKASGEYERIYNKWYRGGLFSQYTHRERTILSVGIFVLLIIGSILALTLYYFTRARHASEKMLKFMQERDDAAGALINSEKQFKDFAKSAAHWMWETDSKNRFTYISRDIEKNINTSRNSFLGKTRWETAGDIPENIKQLQIIDDKTDQLQPFEAIQYQVPLGEGENIWVEVNGMPFFNQENRYCGYRGTARIITKRKWIELELKKSEERYRSAAQLASLGNWVWDMKDSKCVYCSAEYATIFGVSTQERNTLPTINYENNEWIHPEDRNRVGYIYDEAGRTGSEIDIEYRIIRKDGEIRNVHEKIIPTLGLSGDIEQYAGVIQDITELKRAELRASRNLEQVKKTLDSIRDIFFAIDGQYNLVYANQQAHLFFHVDPESVIKSNLWDLAPELISFFYKKLRKVLVDQQSATFEGYYSLNNKWYDVRAFPSEGGASIFLLDITSRKTAESQVLQSSKLATLGQMASGIAHEMNQPLNIISMTAENMIGQIDGGDISLETVQGKMERVLSQSERMSEIINHMRTFSRDSDGKGSLFQTAQSVTDALNLIEQQFHIYDIDINIKIDDRKAQVIGSTVQLEQVIINLLSNAKDAIQERSRKVRKFGRSFRGLISVQHLTDNANDSVIITVEDNGGGIIEGMLDHIFDPFYSTKEEGKGTGLGLSISYSIIQSMGGTLTACNDGGGAKFEITLPIYKKAQLTEITTGIDVEKTKDRIGNTRQLSVLVVDDEELAAEDLAEYLERKGHSVQTATDGELAFKRYQNGNFDVVITDLRMPKMDGYELMSKIHERTPNLPVFIITGHTTIGEDRDIEAKGALHVMTKPISLKKIAENLKLLQV